MQVYCTSRESTSQMRILILNRWGGFYTLLFSHFSSTEVSRSCLCSCHCKSLGHQGEQHETTAYIRAFQKKSRKTTGLQPGLSGLQFARNFSKRSEEGNLACCHESCKEGNYLIAESIWFLKSTGRLLQRWTSEIHTVGEGASWGKKKPWVLP